MQVCWPCAPFRLLLRICRSAVARVAGHPRDGPRRVRARRQRRRPTRVPSRARRRSFHWSPPRPRPPPQRGCSSGEVSAASLGLARPVTPWRTSPPPPTPVHPPLAAGSLLSFNLGKAAAKLQAAQRGKLARDQYSGKLSGKFDDDGKSEVASSMSSSRATPRSSPRSGGPPPTARSSMRRDSSTPAGASQHGKPKSMTTLDNPAAVVADHPDVRQNAHKEYGRVRCKAHPQRASLCDTPFITWGGPSAIARLDPPAPPCRCAPIRAAEPAPLSAEQRQPSHVGVRF